MSARVGSRIVAVRDANDTTVNIYGRGVYAGRFPRPGSGHWAPEDYERARNAILTNARNKDDSWLSDHWDRAVADGKVTREEADERLTQGLANLARERAKPMEQRVRELLIEMDLNPRLDLDDGSVVWGCECWWMSEQRFTDFLGDRLVAEVPVQRPSEGDRMT